MLPIKNTTYMEIMSIIAKVHGPLRSITPLAKEKFNFTEGKTSYRFFDNFENDWLGIITNNKLSIQKHLIVMQMVVDYSTVCTKNGDLNLLTKDSVVSPFT